MSMEIRLGLESMNALIERLDHPQKKLKFIHVAGTNGKGSASALISSICREAGYKTGVYTSPYLRRVNESIKINDREISDEEISRITAVIKERLRDIPLNPLPTKFEMETAMAFLYFHEQNCDVVVLEVGLGGRLDATNVIDTPLVSVITAIDYDHMGFLGDTLSKIAYEKAGIIKQNGCVVLYPQEKEVEALMEEICRERGVRLHKADFSSIRPDSFDLEGQAFDFEAHRMLKISLLGDHQLKNAALAITTVEELRSQDFQISDSALRAGLAAAKWPGRFEAVHREPTVMIDGAHNVQGAKALAENIKRYFPGQKCTFITGVLGDKEYESMMQLMLPLADRFITVTPENQRALPAQELAKALSKHHPRVTACETVEEAIEMSLQGASPQEIICAFGSLYYIGRVREYFFPCQASFPML